MLTENLDQRLQWFQEHRCSVGSDQFILEENREEGYTKIICKTNKHCLIFHIEKHGLKCLINESCADHIIFERVSDQSWNLHIIECKKSVGDSEWEKIKKQFEGALLNALALMGVLGIEKLEEIKCYTAFRRDKLTVRECTNPALLKTLVGGPASGNPILEWRYGRVQILSIKNITHRKIQLDQETGLGNLML